MELMEGPLDVAKLDGILKSIVLMFVAKSLVFLHSQGIVHLDLKPAYILMKGRRAKIGDFGSAKLFGLSVTQTSMALTQSYASPEALDGQAPHPSMDVYSFAMIAYELATGEPAFDPKLPIARLIGAIMGGRLPQVPGSVHPALKQVLERGWAMDPKERPTMAQVCEILTTANWCVFPGADSKEVAEAEMELPKDVTALLTRVAQRFEKLEGERMTLNIDVAQIPGSKIQAVKSVRAGLKSETATLNGENSRMKAGPAPNEPVAGAPVQRPNVVFQAGTLLAENAAGVRALWLKVAELLLAQGSGGWDVGEFNANVVGKAPVLVLVEFAGGVCGGLAAVPFERRKFGFIPDPTGTSFVFSLRPKAARYALKDKAEALCLGPKGFAFGDCCIGILDDGWMMKREQCYAVPSGWAAEGEGVEFARFEVWRVAA
jgi:hypothetical protein